MIHASLAFCNKKYYSKVRERKSPLPARQGVEYKPLEKDQSNSKSILQHFEKYFDLQSGTEIEMDIFANSEVSTILEKLKSASGGEKNLWAYHLVMATVSGSSPCFLVSCD